MWRDYDADAVTETMLVTAWRVVPLSPPNERQPSLAVEWQQQHGHVVGALDLLFGFGFISFYFYFIIFSISTS